MAQESPQAPIQMRNRPLAIPMPCNVLIRDTMQVNKQPRGKPRGISEQRELVVSVQHLVGLTLLFYILPDHLLVPVLTHRTREISIGPEFPTP